jgi:hypothetical protein
MNDPLNSFLLHIASRKALAQPGTSTAASLPIEGHSPRFSFFTSLFLSPYWEKQRCNAENCRMSWASIWEVVDLPYYTWIQNLRLLSTCTLPEADLIPSKFICNPSRWAWYIICPQGNHKIQHSWWVDCTPMDKTGGQINGGNNSPLPGGG